MGLGVDNYDLAGTPGGLAAVAWTHAVTIDDRVIQAAVRPADGIFGDPENISSGDHAQHRPHVAVNAGLCTVTWTEETTAPDDRDVKAATRTADGTWSSAEDVSAAGG